MKIESDDYYSIILSENYYKIGDVFLKEVIEKLQQNDQEDDIDDLKLSENPAYRTDTRCLIGFALSHDKYEFGVGGLCHVVGHQVIKPLIAVQKITEGMQHEAHAKILKMTEAVQAAPR